MMKKDDNRENKGQLQQPQRTIMITMMTTTMEVHTLSLITCFVITSLAALAFSPFFLTNEPKQRYHCISK